MGSEQAQLMDDYRAKVLLVDDEENILKSLKRLLLEEEIDIFTANSGEAGLEVLRSTPGVDLIVSDQRMPGLTGAEFLQKSREIVPNALRIMLTGYADINATIDAINKGGAFRYLSKPWDDEEMLKTIRESVFHCRLMAENQRLHALVEKQNEELKEWNGNLKNRVLEQTAAIRVRNEELSGLNSRLQKDYENCLKAFSGLVALRSRELEAHSRNVEWVSVMITEGMNLPEEEKETIKVAAMLHDIGKIGITDFLLPKKPEAMTTEELGEYSLHSVRGQAAIDTIVDLRPAGKLIRHHHENYDGSGFPDRLAGEDIPIGARIIALADFVDQAFAGMQADNALERALAMAREESGKKFDPALLPHLAQAVKDTYSKYQVKTGMREMELPISELREGMNIVREVRSGTGILLLGVGETLDITKIQALRRYNLIDPPKKGILVRFQSTI
jgi:response regulator RpfG family c-di-GMP phosphodiesterase